MAYRTVPIIARPLYLVLRFTISQIAGECHLFIQVFIHITLLSRVLLWSDIEHVYDVREIERKVSALS